MISARIEWEPNGEEFGLSAGSCGRSGRLFRAFLFSEGPSCVWFGKRGNSYKTCTVKQRGNSYKTCTEEPEPMKKTESLYQDLKPKRKDWAFALISLAFVATGIFILPKNRNVGIVTIAFFGVCAGTFLITIFRKLRESKFQSVSVGVSGGVDIKPSRLRAWMMALLLISLGTVLAVFGDYYPFLFRILAYVIAGFGIVLAAMILLGKIPVGFLRFDSDGFRIGRRNWTVLLPWDEIAEARAGEFNSNAAVFLFLRSFDRVRTEPEEFYEKAIQEILSSEGWIGSHFMILTSNYGISSPVLAEAIERYRSQPEAREELNRMRIGKEL